MNRYLTLLLTLSFGLSTVLAQPRFVPDNDIKKVGEVEFQVPRQFSIGFTNKGDKPLQLKSVTASCGCLDVSYPRTAIAPGARGEIKLTYDAKLLGTFYKEIEVTTSASEEPVYIAIQGTVVTEMHNFSDEYPIDLGCVRLMTNTIEFDDVNKGDHPTAELRILNTDRTAFRPELMHLPPYLTAEAEDIPAGKSGVIHLTLDSEKLPQLGLNQTSIYLSRYLGDKISEVNEVLVSAILLPGFSHLSPSDLAEAPELAVSESSIDFGAMNGKKTLTRTILLTNTGKKDLNIKQVQVFNRAISVSIADRIIRPGKSTKLKVSVSARYLEKAKGRKRVLLITDAPNQAKQFINVEITL